jgi:hypothetical protein
MSTSTDKVTASSAGSTVPAAISASDPGCLRPAAGTLTCEVGDELLVYLPASRAVVALNASARAVWELCEGGRTVHNIAEALGARLGVAPAALAGDVARAVTEFRDAGLLEPAER